MLKNCMEDVVDDILPIVLGEYNSICLCEKCIQDIKAIALNNLPPLYGVTEAGKVYLKINQLKSQFRIDVVNQLIRAIDLVTINTRHP